MKVEDEEEEEEVLRGGRMKCKQERNRQYMSVEEEVEEEEIHQKVYHKLLLNLPQKV